MRKIKLVILLLAALVTPVLGHAQNRRDRGEGRGNAPAPAEGRAISVRAIAISVSKDRGATDRRVAPYESNLRAYFPTESFHFAGEASATVPAGGKASMDVQGQRIDLQNEGGSVFARTSYGGAPVMPGKAAVFVRGANAIVVVAQ
jgi:hypothetical protein